MHSRKNPSKNSDNFETDKVMRRPIEDVVNDDEGDAEAQSLLPMHVVDSSSSPSRSSSSSSSSLSSPTQAKKIGTAMFYAFSSIWVIFANKIVLSTYKFPSVLTIALLQFGSTTLALKVASAMGYVSLLPISPRGVRSILPLSTCYLLNILTGLSATQNLSLPMMVLLRRASILMTMLLEKWMLKSQPSKTVQLSVGLMLGGAFVAALGDLSFNTLGYIVIFFNDLFTALNGVILKRTSEGEPDYTIEKNVRFCDCLFSVSFLFFSLPQCIHRKIATSSHPEYKKSNMTVLYLNSLLSAMGVSIIIMMVPGEVERVVNFALWSDVSFITNLVFAALMGSVLNLAIFLCTSTNSALTTTVVGCLKNVLTSYLGMFVGGDYIFSWLNFLGINISIAGSLIYAHATFRS
ncbi:hypothetical protein ACHAW5_011200 [Stephanodiscus triporus]|uniref:Sugar phosphate transporter domain-containing protein n=1 Tax=Stephanodiscus triporus TaxID=2934178 RepID=A0ABD3QW85_9STRA